MTRRGNLSLPARARKRRRSARGGIAVEFGLIAPALILLVMGIIDFGWAVNRETMVNNVSRDAVRVASLQGSYDDVEGAVVSGLGEYGINLANVTYSITCTNTSGTNCTGSETSYDANVTSGSTVVVSITYDHPLMTPVGALCKVFGGNCVGNEMVLHKTVQMVRE